MQKFSTKDPLHPDFWNERFDAQFTPWDQGGVPQALTQFIARTAAPLVTLIPGCGLGYEAAFLARSGWDVTAIDFSPSAVASARSAVGEWSEHIVEADFFTYQPIRPPELIYERAFLCSMPVGRRPDIIRRWAALLPAGGLLAGFFFIDNSLDPSLKGPPFSITTDELYRLLYSYFELLEDSEVTDSIAVFAGKERWQVWRRLGAS
jgi:SAM-dependent methyltransferase